VDVSLHLAIDKYAMFAVTRSHKFLDVYIGIVKGRLINHQKYTVPTHSGLIYSRYLQNAF